MGTERVGFVGVGPMGHGVARDTGEGGHPLAVLAPRLREPAVADDVVVPRATGSRQVGAVVEGPDGPPAAGVPLPSDVVAEANGLSPRP